MNFWQELQSPRCVLTAIDDRAVRALLPFFELPENLYFYLPTALISYDYESLKRELASWSDGLENLAWTIKDREGRILGLANFEALDRDNGSVEMGLLLADPETRGRGYGTEVARRLLSFAFVDLDLHRVSCRVMAGNEGSFALLSRLAFTHEGIARERIRRPDRYVDLHHFAILKEEWEGAYD